MITSKTNKYFKLYKSLKYKKYRDETGLFLVYGKHLIEKAKAMNCLVEIITDDPKFEGMLYDKALFDELVFANQTFHQIGVCKKTHPTITQGHVLLLDDVQDPDNVGALLRSAAAFGFMRVFLSPQSADVYNEKTVRASMGALFDLDIQRRPLIDIVKSLKNQGYVIVYADAHEEGTSEEASNIALILGNEGRGIHKDLKALADRAVHIPTQHVESLNVSVAGGILMYQWRKP